jgi:hypothetical protein
MPPQTAVRPLLAAAILVLMTACARGVAVQSEPGPAYALQVDNPMPYPMIVSYDDGTGSHLLGTVSAGTQGRFVITRPARQELTIIATNEARTQTITRAVTVHSGVTTEVTLSP